MGRLMSGPYSPGVSRQRVDPAFMSRLVAGPFPFEVLGPGQLVMGVGPGRKVPTRSFTTLIEHPYFYKTL